MTFCTAEFCKHCNYDTLVCTLELGPDIEPKEINNTMCAICTSYEQKECEES